MNKLNEVGATADPAAMAPWAEKYRVGHPETHNQDNINEMKATDQSPPVNAHIAPRINKDCDTGEVR